MAEDLMSTQTGGYGETIQSSPETTPTPEQFNVQLPPAEQTQQPAPETTPQPTPPTQEGVPTENVTAQVDVAQSNIPTEPPVTPEQPPIQEQPPLDVAESEVKFSGMTSDGEVIFDPSQVKAAEDKPLDFNDELEYTEKEPTQTSSGEVILGMGPQDESEAINEVYSGSTVKLKGSRVISFKQNADPDKPKKPKSDGFYRYAGQPDSIYKKSDGDWYKSTDGGDNYFKIAKGDVDRRIDILEAEATKYSNPTAKASALATKMVGNLGKFNLPNQMVTAGGSTTVSKNVSFDDLVKPNVGTETDRYNKDGTLNFNYNAKVATMAPENKAIYEASKKADGLYRFSGREDALYKKEGSNWYIDLSGTGDKFEWIDSETPKGKERIQTLQTQAVPAATYATLKTVLTKVPDASTLGKIQNPFELIDVSNEINTLNQIVESDQLKSVFDQGKNFVDTEIMNFTKDNLTKDQKENLIALQADINEIIGDGSYSDLKAKKVAELLANGQQFFDDAVAINEKVNRAYSAGISIDRLNYENKKKTFAQDFDQKTTSEADMYAAKLFQDVRWMSDFVLENVDAGNLKINPDTGAFTFTENASEAERKYIDAKLSEYLKRYEGIQSQRFAEVKDKIYEDKAALSDTRANIEALNDQLEQARRRGDTEWASQISGAIKLEKQKISALQKRISDNENMSNTLFLTNPKKVIQSVAGLETASSRAAFEATPKGLTPKQRFDLYYENLQKKNQEIAKRNNINYASLDRFDMRLKDLLDYGDFYSLSDAEQEFLKNKATLNALKSLYYNNDTGYTGSTAGFWNSFVNGYARALQPKTSAADGYQSEKEKLKVVDMAIEEIGFADEDFVTPDAVEKIKEQSVIDFWSKESLGSMVGTSGAYMQMITLASETPGFALKILANGEKLITGAKTITQAEKYAQGLISAYDAALDTTKLGRFIKAPIQEGINFQLASEEFNDPDNQLNFLSGLSGGVFGEGFAAIAQKMGATKAGNYVASIFGSQADTAVKTLTRVGKMASRGLGELPQETGEELANIYMSSDNFQQMMQKASESFGSFDKIQQFVISTFILGTAFGVMSPKSAKEAYNSMPEDKRKQVNALLADLKSDMNKGQQAANNYAETMLNREDSKTKAEENDKENKPGVSGEERVGEKPVETQPVDESGKEAPSPSGVVQEEPGKTEEVAPTEPVGKTGELTSDEDIASKINQAVEENAGLKDVLMSLIGYDPSAKGPKTSKIAQPKGFDSEEIVFLYNEAKADGSNPELVAEIEKIIMPTTQEMLTPEVNEVSSESDESKSAKLGRGKGGEMTEDTELKSSGFDPNDNLFSKPELAKNTNFGWRTMGTDEFNSLASGEKKYQGGAPEGGNWISGVPESSAKFGGKGKVMVEFGGIDIKGGENMSAGSTADRNNVTKVWKYNSDTQQFEEAPELLDTIKNGSKLETPSEKTNDDKIAELQNQIDEIFDKSIPALEEKLKKTKDEYGLFADGYNLEGINKQRELYKSNDVDIDDLLTDEQKSIIGEIQSLQDKSDELENQISDLDEEEETKSYEDLANKIRNIKIDTRGTAMSSLPGLVEAWNLAVEAAATAVEVAGATADALQKGIAAAEKAFKESDFYKTLKDRDERLRYMNDLRNGIQQTLEEKKPTGKQKKAGKEFKGQVEEVTGVKPNRETVTLTEAEALKTRIRAEVAAAKDAAKAIDKIKQDVIDFAKGSLPKESYSQKELNRVLAAVRRAKDEKSLNKAVDSISGLVERKNEQIRKKKISDIRKKIKDKKTLYTKVDGKWRGKVTVDAQEEFNEFIGDLSDLEAMSMEELTEVEEIINGIVENGRAEFNRLKAITEDRKKRQAADMLEELAVTQPSTSETMFFQTFDPEMVGEPEGGPDAILSDNEAVKTFLEDRKGNIVVIDGKMYTASSYKSSKYNDKANPEPIPSPAKGYKKINLTEEKRIIEEKKTAVDKLKDSVRRVAVLDNMYGMLQKIGKGAPKTTKFINDNIVKPIQDYFIDSQVSVKERMDSYKEGLKDIFGSEKKASVRLNENASVNPLERSKEKGVGVSNSILVSLYNLSRLNNGIQRLKNSGVNTDELIEYIESNQDLLDYANFLVDQYNEMKAEYEPTYISVTGMPFPEGYYYPAYSEANFDDDVLSETDIIDPEGNFSALNAMVNNLKQRNDNAGSAFNTSLGAEEIFIDYVKNMERAKYLIPVARSANQLFAQQNRPYLVNILGPNALNELQKSLAVVFTGKRPPKDYAEGTMDKVMNYNTLITLGFKLKSIPTQMTSFINFWGEGIKDGINPLKVISAFPTNATEREFLREVAFSEYLRERRKGTSLDLEVKRMLNIKNQNAFQRVWNKLITENVMKLPGLADWLTSISPFGGGGSYAIAQLRNELSKGVPLEEAKKNAFRNFVRAVEETQQTSREDYTASFQRSTIGRMFSTYKTSQIGFARKIVSGYRTLGDPKATDTEKVQAYYDMIFYSFASSVLFSLVANGGSRVLSSLDDEDFDEKLRVIYDLAIDQAQSVAQGFGFGGFIVDEIINHARQDEWKNNVSFIQFLLNSTQSIADIYKRTTQDDLTDPKMSEEERMRFFQEMGISSEYYNDEDVEKVIQLYKESSIWRKMTPQERKNLLKTAGLKNIVEQINDFYEYSQGNQSFLDAFMNYEKDYFESAKKKGKTDYIFKKLFGEDYIPKKRPESAEPEYVGEEIKENVDKGLKLEEINN